MSYELIQNKKVLVMGLGRFGGGVDSAKFASANGADVLVTDIACANELEDSIKQLDGYERIEYRLGEHHEEDFQKADIIIANPAVPENNQFLQAAKRSGVIVTSQVGIFFEYCKAKTIGITGSNGKSTTTALTYHLLKNSSSDDYNNVWLSGNIGNEPMLMLLDKIESNDLVVLELSSFQVEQLAAESKGPDVALITNLLPNHLDRYGTFENYCDAKEKIFAHQGAQPVSIFNSEDEIIYKWYQKYNSESARRCITYKASDMPEKIQTEFKLPGEFNLSNLAGAMSIVKLFGVSDESIAKCVGDFRSLPDRLELIGEKDGIKWYNDSKSTTPGSAIAAVNAFNEPVVLIAGGYDKKLPFDKMGEVVAGKAKAVILIGETAGKIKTSIEKNATENKKPIIKICEKLEQAVSFANTKAAAGDVVLLSPGCASYDMFDNYQQRGRQFIEAFKTLSK